MSQTWKTLCRQLENQSVITDTLRREDTVPAMAFRLKDLITAAWRTPDLPMVPSDRHQMWSDLNDILTRLNRNDAEQSYWPTEQPHRDFVTLMESLDMFSPPGFTFGPHPDDPASLGWYQMEE